MKSENNIATGNAAFSFDRTYGLPHTAGLPLPAGRRVFATVDARGPCICVPKEEAVVAMDDSGNETLSIFIGTKRSSDGLAALLLPSPKTNETAIPGYMSVSIANCQTAAYVTRSKTGAVQKHRLPMTVFLCNYLPVLLPGAANEQAGYQGHSTDPSWWDACEGCGQREKLCFFASTFTEQEAATAWRVHKAVLSALAESVAVGQKLSDINQIVQLASANIIETTGLKTPEELQSAWQLNKLLMALGNKGCAIPKWSEDDRAPFSIDFSALRCMVAGQLA